MNRELFLSLRQAEIPKTLRLLELYPEEQKDLRPSPKSRTALEIAQIFRSEERVMKTLIETGSTPTTPAPRLNSMAEAIAALRDASDGLTRAVEALSEADYVKPVHFYRIQLPLNIALMIELLDHIHHRGQFTMYSRMAGARVPQIYGPSGDEP
jgi:uncharacterized damage-inducible protein DinB